MEEKKFSIDTVSVRLVKNAPIYSDIVLNSPERVLEAIGNLISEFDREVICIMNLKTDLTPINVHFASMGALDATLTHPREMIKSTILSNAAKIIMIHNHPSNRIEPSDYDVEITDRLNHLCKLIEIPLLDHIIIGTDTSRYYSFAEKGKIDKAELKFEREISKLHINSR